MPSREQSPEEMLGAALAARDENIPPDDDLIPPDEDIYGWPDPDCGPPAELAGLTDAELVELAGTNEPGGDAEAGLAGWLTRNGPGDGRGFADGGVLDVLAAGLPLAGFAEDTHDVLTQITDDELIGLIAAWRRLSSWASARELAAVAELARRRPAEGAPPAAPGNLPGRLSEFIPDEVAAALTLTRGVAQAETELALDLTGVLRGTGDALAAGRIDLPKAKILADGTGRLSVAHATAVQATVLPDAPEMTTGQLRRAVAAAVLAADPDAARQQREEAAACARVDCWPDPVGTATLAGYNLPAAEVLAADRRLGRIARAWQKLGAGGGVDLLRAWAYLALLLGHSTDVPPAHLLAVGSPGEHGTPGRKPDPEGSTSRPQDGTAGPDDRGPAGLHDRDLAGLHDRDLAGPQDRDLTGPQDTGPAGSQIPPGLGRPGGADRLLLLAGSVNLTIPLTTLMGLSDAPGAAAGFGPLEPDAARALACAAAGHRATRWHLTVVGPDGRALGRGSASGYHRIPAPDGPDGRWTVNVTAEPVATGGCDHRNREAQYRPGAALQRLIRDRSTACSYYGCGRPAVRCDLDHTIPYDQGGLTCECNLAPVCRTHHRMKQAEGWALEQITPGVMAWLTPAGRRYITLPSRHPT